MISTLVRPWAVLAGAGVRQALAYRFSLVTDVVMLAARLVLFVAVWRAVYSGSADVVNGIDENTAVGYAVLAQVVGGVLVGSFSPIRGRIREGLIAIDLLRPHGFIGQMLSLQLGVLGVGALVSLVGIPVGVLLGADLSPTSVNAAGAALVSVVLAVVIGLLLALLLGLTSFWTLEVGGIQMIYGLVSSFLAGVLVPLWLMPDWLRTTAGWLPFQASTFTPIAIWQGQAIGGVLRAIGVQALWIIVLSLVAALVWRRARRRVVVQGG
jgi:ABC-2 type transport system permease protein